MTTTLLLGTHKASWLAFEDRPPLFVSLRTLALRRSLPAATCSWALDSGGFSELTMFGGWQTSEAEYVEAVRRFRDEIGSLAWVAPQDWMCEPFMLERTGLTIGEHQERTVRSVVSLRQQLGELVIPVVQGYERDDYLRCAELYERAGLDLSGEPLVGVGSVCRRQSTAEAAVIFEALHPLRLHGFGVKTLGLARYGPFLASADSLAWSYDARRSPPLPGCPHASCANCFAFAWRWWIRARERWATATQRHLPL